MLVNDFVTDLNNFHRVSYCRSSLTLAFFFIIIASNQRRERRKTKTKNAKTDKSLSVGSVVCLLVLFPFPNYCILHLSSLSVYLWVFFDWLNAPTLSILEIAIDIGTEIGYIDRRR